MIVDLDARTDDGERYLGDLSYEVSWGPAEAIPRCPGIPVAPARLPDEHRRRSAPRRRPAGNPVQVRSQGGPRQSGRRQRPPLPGLRSRRRYRGPRLASTSSACNQATTSPRTRSLRHRARSGPQRPPLFSCDLWHGKIRVFTLGLVCPSLQRRAGRPARGRQPAQRWTRSWSGSRLCPNSRAGSAPSTSRPSG